MEGPPYFQRWKQSKTSRAKPTEEEEEEEEGVGDSGSCALVKKDNTILGDQTISVSPGFTKT